MARHSVLGMASLDLKKGWCWRQLLKLEHRDHKQVAGRFELFLVADYTRRSRPGLRLSSNHSTRMHAALWRRDQ